MKLSPKILSFFKKYNIHRYKVNDDGRIDVFQDVDLSGKGLKKIPFKIHRVYGDFIVRGNKLVSCENSPDYVRGNVDYSFNAIRTLKGCVKEVGSGCNYFRIDNNFIKSFKHCIKDVDHAVFSFDNNPIQRINHAPKNAVYPSTDPLSGTKIVKSTFKAYMKLSSSNSWNPDFSIQENLRVFIKKRTREFLHPLFSDLQEYYLTKRILKQKDIETAVISNKFGL